MGEKYAIWWLSQQDCEAIGGYLPTDFPNYMAVEYRDRLGRNGRGRLWVARNEGFPEGLGVEPWPDNLTGAELGRSYAGIVLHPQDAKLVAYMPGIVTDMNLNTWRDDTPDMGDVSDGYHTFNELYEHRHVLFLLLMKTWFMVGYKTWVEVDESMPGWFLAGIDTEAGQVSYHLPGRLLPVAQKQVSWGYTRVPYDGYTAADVLKRLQMMCDYDKLVGMV